MANQFFSAQGGGGTPVVPTPDCLLLSFTHGSSSGKMAVIKDSPASGAIGEGYTTLTGPVTLDSMPEGVNSITFTGTASAYSEGNVHHAVPINSTVTASDLQIFNMNYISYDLAMVFTNVTWD